MSGPPPLRRVALWSFLAASILAVAVAFVMSPRWAAEGRPRTEAPPVLDTLPDFSLVRSDGGPATLADLRGGLWVANFVFSRCQGNCPRLTAEMAALGERLGPGPRVRRVSFSVDPAHDTPEVLARYAAAQGVDDESWLFLTGDPDEMTTLFVDGFKLGFGGSPEPTSSIEPILHTTRFVLVDEEGRIRGYYDVFEPADRVRLERDIKSLRGGAGDD